MRVFKFAPQVKLPPATRSSMNNAASTNRPSTEPIGQNHRADDFRSRDLRELCAGELPLSARLEPWMIDQIAGPSAHSLVNQYGSPLNLTFTSVMARNIDEINRVAQQRHLDFRVFFARKSNKCLALVDQAIQSGIGIDTASENEIRQCLTRDANPADLICTAAIKTDSLIRLCIDQGICIAVDNHDELAAIAELCQESSKTATVALRIGGFQHQGQKLFTRFGFDIDRDASIVNQLGSLPLSVQGIHFHLDGYDAGQRVTAIAESLRWINRLRESGHRPSFIDMGGGFPVSYLDDPTQWEAFLEQHANALLGRREPITYQNHGLGRHVADGKLLGESNCYPSYQSSTRSDWLAEVLDSKIGDQMVAACLQSNHLQLRCEPGRSLLDGCGMTVARVEFRKQNSEGDWLIGLSMNRTQCRTTHEEFLVDPILIGQDHHKEASISGYLVGAYCTESELISLRRFHFPNGIQRGDLIAFPNTAGYLMHFLESRSHQFPLASNLVIDQSGATSLDPIDQSTD
ncbi:Y4yA family PLP-dependent enzyme [Stieleria marina]|uniref:Diaminopimelate decarboxylase n=1 Tax=Stieleria marina TaxID=1930275 RepID=A0A517NLW6_9BACT|nr:Diaminopimelate decarboxylase [Planctomycetes bacterium K23_9]